MIESFSNTSTHFQITFFLYVITFLGYRYFQPYFNRKPQLKYVVTSLMLIAFLSNSILLIDKWIEAGAPKIVVLDNGSWSLDIGRPPFRTLYESLMFATWTITLVYLIMELTFKMRLLGTLSTLGVIYIFLYALARRDVETTPLMPALQTWIFVPHVISYFIAYAAFFIAFVSAVKYIIPHIKFLQFIRKKITHFMNPFKEKLKESLAKRKSLFKVYISYLIWPNWFMKEEDKIDLSKYTYSIAKFGFLFLTVGLVLGSWWGQEAWSNYWGWDPKENWALISWFIFISYFHLKRVKSWGETKLSMIIIIGFFIIIFTYVGMKYLPKSVQQGSDHIYIE